MSGKNGQPVHRPRVAIIGAGFAGLNAAKALRKKPVDVLLIDRNNYHKFQPLLYQVATSGLEADEVAHNIRDLFRGYPNLNARLGTVRDVDLGQKQLHFLKGPSVPYDYLIVGAGAVTSYFGVEGASEHAFPLKNLSDAVRLRNHILRQFERYERDPEEAGENALHFVVVGGGPTGIETAGALSELFRVIQKDFPRLDTTRARVTLIEMLPRLLSQYHEESSTYTRHVLEKRGVEVRTEVAVERIEPDHILLKGGEKIETRTLIWAAGVRANPLADALGAEQDRAGRIAVEPDLSLPGHPEVFIVGDMSGAADEEGRAYAQLAPVAVQQGKHAARQIMRKVEGASTERFAYVDQGQMATIGRNAAVAELPGGVRIHGFVAWLMWVFVHVAKLIGFRNRVNVMVNWAYNYLTYDRNARLIFDMVPISDELPREAEDIDRHVQESMQELEARGGD